MVKLYTLNYIICIYFKNQRHNCCRRMHPSWSQLSVAQNYLLGTMAFSDGLGNEHRVRVKCEIN